RHPLAVLHPHAVEGDRHAPRPGRHLAVREPPQRIGDTWLVDDGRAVGIDELRSVDEVRDRQRYLHPVPSHMNPYATVVATLPGDDHCRRGRDCYCEFTQASLACLLILKIWPLALPFVGGLAATADSASVS